MERQPCVYILASRKNGTLYVGVTSDLIKRIWEHKNDAVKGFTKRYEVHTLVWLEMHGTMESAITREKAIKEWKRKWKLNCLKSPIRNGEICMKRLLKEPLINSSFRRKPESRVLQVNDGQPSWTPAFAGVTKEEMFDDLLTGFRLSPE